MPWNIASVTNQHSPFNPQRCLRIWALNIKHNILNFLKSHKLGKEQKKNKVIFFLIFCTGDSIVGLYNRREKWFCFLDNRIKWVPPNLFLKILRILIYSWNMKSVETQLGKEREMRKKITIIWLYDNLWTFTYLIVLCKSVERMVIF